ncbi:CHAT domain-containing protein [Thermodesulfobacteriota bacterium]
MIEKNIHPLILESLIEEEEDTFRMLKSPIYRRLSIPGRTNTLLFGPKNTVPDINCLIIESNLPEGTYVEKIDKEFEWLENVPVESDWIERYLNGLKEELNIGEVERINENETPNGITFKEYVLSMLEKNEWHLVHYAGHSFYDKNNHQAYVFFPKKSEIEAISIKMFSKWLRDARTSFIYLSSCRSSEENFVFELAKNQIPVIIGFRWDIEDLSAAEHAKKFYQNLFERTRSLEYAFLETRKEMYERNPENKVWAAPILILQVID